MPARSNKQQAVVYFVKRHKAPAGATVVESDFLFDAQQGAMREVDVVVRSTVGDDEVIIGVEVTGRKARADVTWVDSQLMKHSHMPTNKLLLVSWAGFSKGALRKIDAQGGRVEALAPTRVESVDVKMKFLQEVRTQPTRVAVLIQDGSDERWILEVPLQALLFPIDTGRDPITLAELIEELSKLAGEQISKEVFHSEDRDSLSHYTTTYEALRPLRLCVELGGERLRVLGISVIGELLVKRHEMAWEFWRLGPTLFATTELTLNAGPRVWVLTPQDDGSETVSWRPIA